MADPTRDVFEPFTAFFTFNVPYPDIEMKVVLFCGGKGTRIRAASESTPKPLLMLLAFLLLLV